MPDYSSSAVREAKESYIKEIAEEDVPKVMWDTHANNFLAEMQQILVQRGAAYGDRRESFAEIAQGWSAIFRQPVTPRQVAKAFIWVKLIRDSERSDHDNMIDASNYALIADFLE